MRLFNKLASVAVIAGLTSGLRLDAESHIETQTHTVKVTEYTAILNTTEFSLCLNNSGSYSPIFFNWTECDTPDLRVFTPLRPSEADYESVFLCLQQQEIDDIGFYLTENLDLESNDESHKIDNEVITWRGASFDMLSSHAEIVQPMQRSIFWTGIARLSEWKDALLKDIFWEQGITVDDVDQHSNDIYK